MGDRTAVQFKNGDDLSPVLKGQNCGRWLLVVADNFLEKLQIDFPLCGRVSDPITRREPSACLVMFITNYLKLGDADDGDWRLFDSATKCMGTDNGHWIVDLQSMSRYKLRDD